MNVIIKSYADLEAEKSRLKTCLALQASVIREDIVLIQEELRPLQSLLITMRKFVSENKNNSILNAGAGILGDLFFKSTGFNGTALVTRLVAPYLVKNIASRLFPSTGNTILHRLAGKINQLKRRLV